MFVFGEFVFECCVIALLCFALLFAFQRVTRLLAMCMFPAYIPQRFASRGFCPGISKSSRFPLCILCRYFFGLLLCVFLCVRICVCLSVLVRVCLCLCASLLACLSVLLVASRSLWGSKCDIVAQYLWCCFFGFYRLVVSMLGWLVGAFVCVVLSPHLVAGLNGACCYGHQLRNLVVIAPAANYSSIR